MKIAQKPYIIGSLGPKALKYESFDAKGMPFEDTNGLASHFDAGPEPQSHKTPKPYKPPNPKAPKP